MRRRTIVFSVSSILAISLAAIYWTPEKTQAPQVVSRPSSADYYFRQVSIKQFNEKGLLVNQLTANKLEHFKNLQQSRVTRPQIMVHSNNHTNWLIAANDGFINYNNNLLELADNVTIEQLDPDNADSRLQAKIQTQQLTFGLDNNSAHSKTEVLITTAENNTNAQAMSVNFNTEQINLSGQVQTSGFTNDSK